MQEAPRIQYLNVNGAAMHLACRAEFNHQQNSLDSASWYPLPAEQYFPTTLPPERESRLAVRESPTVNYPTAAARRLPLRGAAQNQDWSPSTAHSPSPPPGGTRWDPQTARLVGFTPVEVVVEKGGRSASRSRELKLPAGRRPGCLCIPSAV